MAVVVTGVAAVAFIAVLAATLTFVTPALSGWRGESTLIVRQDVKDLTPQQKATFVAALHKAKRTSSPWNPRISYYDQFVEWHREAFRCRNGWQQPGNWAGAAHNSPTFLPWHRQYLHLFEQMIQRMSGDPTVALPYWDWTDPQSTSAVFADDMLGGNGDPERGWAVTTGPFRKGKWTLTVQDPPSLLKGMNRPKSYLVRNFGAFPPGPVSLPSARQVAWTLRGHGYDHAPYDAESPLSKSFRNRLEGWRDAEAATCDSRWINQTEKSGSPHAMHNVVHIYTGGVWQSDGKISSGTMAYNTSPNDPAFFLHHANVDRIWAAWEFRGGSHYRPRTGAEFGWNAADTMWPWRDRTINSWFGTVRNGYRYAELPS
jgi:tyrosinase